MSFIIVVDKEGRTHQLEAVEGWRVMELLRDQKMCIEGTCGGAVACATCHVVIDEEWVDRLPPPREDELSMLDTVPYVFDNSRLSCQIIWGDELAGLKLMIPRD